MTNRKKKEFQLIAVYKEQNDIHGRDRICRHHRKQLIKHAPPKNLEL